MPDSLKEQEVAEVLIKRDQNSPFSRRPLKHDSVTGIGSSLQRLRHLVALLTQPPRQSPAGAPIHKEPHGQPTCKGANESCAITA
jgi:hypothetical protein